MGGGTSLFALPRRHVVPAADHGVLHVARRVLPSYWLAQAGQVGVGAQRSWAAKGWLVIAAWTVVARPLAAWAYRRDTSRV